MKKSSVPQNVLIIDSDYDEASGFIKGLQEITQEKWKVALYENNKIYQTPALCDGIAVVVGELCKFLGC